MGAAQPNLQKEIALATAAGAVCAAMWMSYAIKDREGYRNFYKNYKPTEDEE